jgi:hypothetical protein
MSYIQEVIANSVRSIYGVFEQTLAVGKLTASCALDVLGTIQASALKFVSTTAYQTQIRGNGSPTADADYRLPPADGSAGQVLSTDGTGALYWGAAISSGTKYTKAFSDMSDASLEKQIALFTLPSKTIILGVTIKHSTAFSGTGITGMTVSVGTSGDKTRYSIGFNVFQAVAAATIGLFHCFHAESFGGATTVYLNCKSVGANLDQLAAGSVDIWVLTATMP